MKEQLKQFWNKHKEGIKTGTILVLTPIAVLGLAATSSLGKLSSFLDSATEMAKEDKK